MKGLTRLEARGGEQAVNFLRADVDLFLALGGEKMFGAQFQRFLLLRVGAGKVDDLTTHLGRKLDRQMTETANADYAHFGGRVDVVHVQSSEDGRTTAHEWCTLFVRQLIGQLEEEGLLPHGVSCKAALV